MKPIFLITATLVLVGMLAKPVIAGKIIFPAPQTIRHILTYTKRITSSSAQRMLTFHIRWARSFPRRSVGGGIEQHAMMTEECSTNFITPWTFAIHGMYFLGLKMTRADI